MFVVGKLFGGRSYLDPIRKEKQNKKKNTKQYKLQNSGIVGPDIR